MEQRVVRLFASRSEWLDRCPQEHCGESARTNIKQRSMRNQSKIDEKSTTNRRKIGLGRFWAIRVAVGTLRGAAGTPQERDKARPGPPRALSGSPRGVPERSRNAPGIPKTLSANSPDASGSVRGAKRGRKRSWIEIHTFSARRAEARICVCTTPASVLLMSDDVRFERQVGAKSV